MTDEEFEAKVKALSFWSGKNSMTIEDMATIQPGLARLMPEVGARTWKLYYAAKAQNWPMAKFQYKEIRGLMELGAFMRPKHEEALNQFLEENWKPLETADREEGLRRVRGRVPRGHRHGQRVPRAQGEAVHPLEAARRAAARSRPDAARRRRRSDQLALGR